MSDWTSRTHRLRRARSALPALLTAGLLGLVLAGCAAKVDRGDEAPQAEPPAEAGLPAETMQTEPPPSEPMVPEPPEGELELEAPPGPAVRKVALLLPLSGQHAGLGEAMLQAAQLALFDAADEDLELLVRDTEGTPAGAEEAARSVIDAGAELVLGPLFASSVRAVAPVAEAAAVNVVAFSNSVSVARPGVYIIGLLPAQQVERVAGFAASRGHQRVAALAPGSDYGRTVVDSLRRALEDGRAEVGDVVFYDPGAEDVSEQVKRLADYDERRARLQARRAELRERDDEAAELALERLEGRDTLGAPPFDAVVLPEGGKRLLAIAPLLPYYDIDPDQVQFLGTALWNDPSLGTEPALVGGWFAAPPPASWREFARRYEEAFGGAPPRLASLAYDATALAAVLDRRFGEDDAALPYTAERLTQPSGFAGVDGVFRLRESGEVERRLAVIELQRNKLRVLDPAPTDFRSLTN